MKVYTVLIVDDSKEWRDIIAGALAKDRMFVPCGQAHDGQTAIRMINSMHPDIIIVDLVMPKLGGLDVVDHVKQIEGYDPFLYVVTGFGSDYNMRTISSLDIDLMSIKPIDQDALLYTLKETLFNQENRLRGSQDAELQISKLETAAMDLLRGLGARQFLASTKSTSAAIVLYITRHRGKKLYGTALYDDVASYMNNGTDYRKVERNIRYAAATIRKNATPLYQEIFKYERDEPPTNLSFIAIVGDYIWEQLTSQYRDSGMLYMYDIG